jgi:hypothetical protein
MTKFRQHEWKCDRLQGTEGNFQIIKDLIWCNRYTLTVTSTILGTYSYSYEEFYLQGYNAVQSVRE